MDARPPEALCNAAQRCIIAVVRWLVQCAEHIFAKGGRYDNASGDGALIAVIEEGIIDDELWQRVRECFQRRIRLELVCVDACVHVQLVNYSYDCCVSALVRDPVVGRVDTIDFCDGACVGGDTSCKLCGDLSID